MRRGLTGAIVAIFGIAGTFVAYPAGAKPTGATTATGTTGTTTTTTTGPPFVPPGEPDVGKSIFTAHCQSCHGPKDEGTGLVSAFGRELPRSESTQGVAEQLEHAVNEKGCRCMPESFPQLSTIEKEDVGAYVVELTHRLTVLQETAPSWVCSSSATECATLIVHTWERAEGKGLHFYLREEGALRIVKLGSGRRCGPHPHQGVYPRCWGKALGNWYTDEHTLRLAPGRYGIAEIESATPTARILRKSTSKEVTVRARQTVKVRVETVAI